MSSSSRESFEKPDSTKWRRVISYPKWLGAIRHTDLGYPYFASQSDVRIVFPHAVKAKCILIEQIGESSQFDWSIVGINLLLPKKG